MNFELIDVECAIYLSEAYGKGWGRINQSGYGI